MDQNLRTEKRKLSDLVAADYNPRKALTPEERDIIMNFYFSENPLSGEALAEKFATTKSSIYRRRDHALRKLKSILGFLFLTAIRRCTKIAKVVVYQRKNLEKRGLFCYN